MGKAAMMLESEHRAAEVGQHIDIWCFSGQRESQRRQTGFAVQAGSGNACASEEMRNWIQVSAFMELSF